LTGLFEGLDETARAELDARLRPRVLPAGEPTVDPAWLGRRLAGASVGVAFGAGGAKGVGGRRCAVQLAACRLRRGRGHRQQYRRLDRGVDGVLVTSRLSRSVVVWAIVMSFS
jgi:hypothetical protein